MTFASVWIDWFGIFHRNGIWNTRTRPIAPGEIARYRERLLEFRTSSDQIYASEVSGPRSSPRMRSDSHVCRESLNGKIIDGFREREFYGDSREVYAKRESYDLVRKRRVLSYREKNLDYFCELDCSYVIVSATGILWRVCPLWRVDLKWRKKIENIEWTRNLPIRWITLITLITLQEIPLQFSDPLLCCGIWEMTW